MPLRICRPLWNPFPNCLAADGKQKPQRVHLRTPHVHKKSRISGLSVRIPALFLSRNSFTHRHRRISSIQYSHIRYFSSSISTTSPCQKLRIKYSNRSPIRYKIISVLFKHFAGIIHAHLVYFAAGRIHQNNISFIESSDQQCTFIAHQGQYGMFPVRIV